MPPTPEVVTLDVWTVAAHAVPRAVWRMAADRRALRRLPGRSSAKLLGTGDGTTFTVRDADPRHWAVLVAWDSLADAERYETSRPVRAWRRFADRAPAGPPRARSAAAAAGRGANPSARPAPGAPRTRRADRLDHPRPAAPDAGRRLLAGRPPVATELRSVPGLRCAIGIGEAPLGYQGTFSLWDSTDALREFAHRRDAHRDVMARTPREGWYAEELFARFAVLSVRGSVGGRTRCSTRRRLNPAALRGPGPGGRVVAGS